jgi:hypothetical protein
MPISPVNFLWLTEPHDLQGMSIPNGNLGLEWLKRFHQPQGGLAFFVVILCVPGWSILL